MGGSIYSARYQEFLRRLRDARNEAGLTQGQVAEKLGEAQSFVSRCESGERRVDIIELVDFAIIYRKSIDYFIDFLLPKYDET